MTPLPEQHPVPSAAPLDSGCLALLDVPMIGQSVRAPAHLMVAQAGSTASMTERI